MAHSPSNRSRGCGSCGGSHPSPAPTRLIFDPCGSNLAISRPQEKSCACGKRGGVCRCNTRPKPAPRPRNYNREDCPTFAISCETKQALRECARTALCDMLNCMSEALCPDGKFDIEHLRSNSELRTDLINCVGQMACSFMHCLPEALCPEPCEPAASPDCLPCGYAVEVLP
jgi:hypothetical protein